MLVRRLKPAPPAKARKQTKQVAPSGNGAPPRLDRRIRRSRDLLGEALVALMHEKPLAAITVQEVIDRAGVSRATFYAHYSGKNDLLFSDAEDFFTAMASLLADEPSQRIAPVAEMFSHLREARAFYLALVTSGKKHEIMELGEGIFARGIAQRLTALQPPAQPSATRAVGASRRRHFHGSARLVDSAPDERATRPDGSTFPPNDLARSRRPCLRASASEMTASCPNE